MIASTADRHIHIGVDISFHVPVISPNGSPMSFEKTESHITSAEIPPTLAGAQRTVESGFMLMACRSLAPALPTAGEAGNGATVIRCHRNNAHND
jgi:hypothetical protein